MKNTNIIEKPLLPNDIEVRVDSITDKTFTLVCYVNPRTAMFYLDEAFGPDKWSKRVTVDKRSQDSPIYAVCSIEVTTPDGETVTREDVGESDKSPKNAASDAIKRAAMNFFPSLRALYTIPQLRVYPSKLGIEVQGKENIKNEIRFKKFYVNSISFEEGETGQFVKSLTIAEEETGVIVCEFRSKRSAIKREDSDKLLQLKKLLAEADATEEEIISRYQKGFRVTSLNEIAATENLYDSAVKYLGTKAKTTKASTPRAKSVNDQLKGKAKEAKEE